MRISQETIQQIQDRADILEVVNDFVSLKKRGSNWMACCPFHHERTPSFSVSPAKGIYKCFGCGRGGDSIRFVMEIEDYSYPEALRYLAQKYGIPIDQEESPSDEAQARQNERESLLIIHEFATRYYQKCLYESPEGKSVGLSYFKERGFLPTALQSFGLGFSQAHWDAFSQEALRNGFSPEVLENQASALKMTRGNSLTAFGSGLCSRFTTFQAK